jgi:hypothetical protein
MAELLLQIQLTRKAAGTSAGDATDFFRLNSKSSSACSTGSRMRHASASKYFTSRKAQQGLNLFYFLSQLDRSRPPTGQV